LFPIFGLPSTVEPAACDVGTTGGRILAIHLSSDPKSSIQNYRSSEIDLVPRWCPEAVCARLVRHRLQSPI
jgi:hypothetical protein